MKKTDHYEQWCEEWRQRFLAEDVEELRRKIPELEDRGDALSICHFGRRYLIRKDTGEILAQDGTEPMRYQVKLNIYTLFGYVQKGASLRGQWVPFSEPPHSRPFVPAFQKGIVEAFAGTFAGHVLELRTAYERIGGKTLPFSDAGGEIYGFDCIPMRCFFWDRDEEFDASANLLFDAGASDFIHIESIVTIAGEGIRRLAEAAGLPENPRLY